MLDNRVPLQTSMGPLSSRRLRCCHHARNLLHHQLEHGSGFFLLLAGPLLLQLEHGLLLTGPLLLLLEHGLLQLPISLGLFLLLLPISSGLLLQVFNKVLHLGCILQFA
ncbi:hypothetical protein GDO81_022771 [Engystomops pustulosus]|uniref:Uncharacterized protein n=1 Tax=Engystomops pustulosus TaxID=76066 RepID=A0AAV6YMB6_ENGPU|nr:hypothetical protein GDO81_022771 [Engystomops pustulosus]